MQYCPSCGASVGDTDAFCERCGAGLAGRGAAPAAATAQPAPPPPPPPPSEPDERGITTPWLVTDWPLAALCVFVFLAIAAGVGGVLGLVAGLIANGPGSEGLAGLLAGAWIMFAGLGTDVFVGVLLDGGGGGVVWFSSGFVIAATLGLVVLAWLIYRAALRYVGESTDFTLAFVAKVAVIGAVAVAILGSVMSIGDVEAESVEGFGVISQVGSAGPAWTAFLLLGLVGLFTSRERIRGSVPSRTDRLTWARPLGYGAAAWAVMVLVLGLGVSGVAIVSSDDATEGITGAALTPVLVGNSGVSAQAFAIGASNDTHDDAFDFGAFSEEPLDAHISLFHYDFPPESDSSAAPIWLWPLLAIAPLLSFLAARRWLERSGARNASTILTGAAAVAGGFALAAWLGALLAPLHAGGWVAEVSDGFDEYYARAVVARPSVGATLGLTLFWAAIGALAAAALWARQHNIDLITSSSSASRTSAGQQPPPGAGAPPPPPPPPPAQDSAGSGICPSCGAPHGGGRFCGNCGTQLASTDDT